MAKRRSTTKTGKAKFAYDAASMRIAVLHGDDDYLMREYTRQLADALRANFEEIEQFSFDGETAGLAQVLDELRSYGLIQRHKLVILDNADEFMKDPKDKKDSQDKDDDDDKSTTASSPRRPAMERYAAQPVDHATLLLRAKVWRKGKIDKLIEKCGMIFKAEVPSDVDLVSWVMGRCKKQYACEIHPDAATLLFSQTGPDLARLDVELSKLAASVDKGDTISREIVAELVGLSREEQVWAIQSAIATGQPARAIAKLEEFQPINSQMQVLIAWAMMDLMKKVHAASQLLKQGVQPFNISKQLKLWGDSQAAVLGAARQLSPDMAAKLLDRAIATDQHNKSGVGEAVRNLEVLIMEIAGAIGGRRG